MKYLCKMFTGMRKYVFPVFLLLLISISGCKSKFEKLRASNNLAKKYEEAVKFYEAEKYSKALVLFEDLILKYRGRSEAEDLYYFNAYTHYRLKDYISARYHFKQFATTFPYSDRAEEARFMSAYSYYLDSPRSSLDQDNTRKAIDELQLFVNIYPESDRAEEAGELIQKLRDKLETKAFDNAKLYYNMGFGDDYRASVIALENMLQDYPDTKYAEEAEYLIIKSQYLFADNSYVHRQESRFNETLDYYDQFIDKYPKSKYLKELNDIREKSEKKINLAVKNMKEIEKQREERDRELGITTVSENTED